MEGRMTVSKQVAGRNHSGNLFAAVRNGTARDVDVAITALKKANGNLDARDRFGSTPLHVAAWRNHVPIVNRLLAAGADPDARDGESGWGSLHRALHFGHLAVAGALIEGGASPLLEDVKGRIPVDLVSGPSKQMVGVEDLSRGVLVRELFGWGNGSNYQLGTGTAGIQRVPCRVEALHEVDVVAVSAAKFHSVAVTSKGDIYSWGYGRGGRLGHEGYRGETAVITPQQIVNGLNGRRVKVVAAAKHHTIVATEGGEAFTWGTNREGQLGYPSVDTQSTPRRVTALKAKVVAVAAANKHSVAVSEAGEVFTWGCNLEGQLGYGISNSASNCVPRVVEYLKGRRAVAVAAAKCHTVALIDGEVFSWGYKMVSPRRVSIARDTRKAGQFALKFHQSERLQVVAVAAGVAHSTAITTDGLIFSWASADPQLHAQQVLSMTGRQAVAVSAGKYRTAVVTTTGDVYAWDSERSAGTVLPVPVRIHGIKRVTDVAVGESHSLAITAIYIPTYSPVTTNAQADEDDPLPQVKKAPSLRQLCQEVLAKSVVEPKNAVQLLEYADALGAEEFKLHCEGIILHNMDYMFQFYAASFGAVRSVVLADLEKAWDARSSQPWSHHQLPVPSATIPAIVDSEEDEIESSFNPRVIKGHSVEPLSGFFQDDRTGADNVSKHSRALRKKLQQIEALELKLSNGQSLDEQQLAKVRTKLSILTALRELEGLGASPQNQKEQDERPKRSGRKAKKRNAGKQQQIPEEEHPQNTDVKFKAPSCPVEVTSKSETSDIEAVEVTTPSAEVTVKQQSVPKEETQVSQQQQQRKAKCRKGGLSMFLSGDLEKKQKPVASVKTEGPGPAWGGKPVAPVKTEVPGPAWGGKPVAPVKTEGPAWGGAGRRVEATSLSDIQKEQSEESSAVKTLAARKEITSPHPPTERPQRISLQHFVRPSNPTVASSPGMVSPKAAPWVGTSPSFVPSLKAIQMQEVKHKEQQHQRAMSLRSPQSPVVGFAANNIATTPDSSERPNCWFKPETSSPSSIRCIQIEEKAMQDLRRLYKHVKMVNPNS